MRGWLLGIAMLGAAACGGGVTAVPPVGDASTGDEDAQSFEVLNNCAALPDLYIAALGAAKSCAPDAGAQCQAQVPLDLVCGCQTYVNDPSALNALAAQWRASGCSLAAPSPLMCEMGCPVATQGDCVAVGGGGACKAN